jgi:hypothetical protein
MISPAGHAAAATPVAPIKRHAAIFLHVSGRPGKRRGMVDTHRLPDDPDVITLPPADGTKERIA